MESGFAMTLLEKITLLCEERHITFGELEELCGFSQNYIAKIDKINPSADRVKRIADSLDVSVDYLLNRCGNSQSHKQPSSVRSDPALKQALKRLSDSAKDVVEILEDLDIK